MLYTAKKIWMGHVSVRDYIINKCIANNEDLTIKLYGIFKTYSPKELKRHLENSYKTEFKSKYTGKTYTLIDLPWDGKENEIFPETNY